jgi:hypothetical protein
MMAAVRGALVMIILGLAPVAAADPAATAQSAIAKAQAALDASDYDAAKAALQDALASGANGPDDLAEIYRLSGIVAGALGDAKEATDAFERLLALSPKATLPVGTSPKIAKPFKAAQDFFKKHDPLRAKTETTEHPAQVALVVASDPLAMVARARVTFRANGRDEKTLEVAGKDRIAVELPRARRLDLRVAALDERGNRLVELGSVDVPIVIVDATAPAELEPKPRVIEPKQVAAPPPKPRPRWGSWRTWGIAAGASVVGAAAFGILTKQDIDRLNYLNAHSLDYAYSDEQAAESRARRDLVVTEVFAAAAGVFAIGTFVLYLTAPHTSERAPSVTAVPVRGGGAIAIGGSF